MKKIILSIIGIIMATSVNAAEVKIEDEAGLRDCISQTNAICTLDENITLSQYLLIDKGKDITLNLNNKTLDLANHSNYAIAVKGKLTIEGEGTVNIPGLYGIGTSVGLGTVVIKGGTYNQSTGDYMFGNFNSFTIENGTFNGNYCILNSFEYNNVKYTAVVKGGTFNNKEETTTLLGYVTAEGGTYNHNVEDYIEEGYSYRVEEGKYIVGKLYKISSFENNYLKITPSKTIATAGEEITLNTSLNANYKIQNLVVKGKEAIEVLNNSFKMPESDVTISAEAVLSDTIKVTEIISDEKNIDVVEEMIKNNQELSQIVQGKNTDIDIQISQVDPEKVEENKKKSITTAAGKAKVVNYFDISVAIMDVDQDIELKKLENLEQKISFKMLLADDLKNTDKQVKRTYYIIREHNGTSEIIPCTLSDNGSYLNFETDRFSIYAIAYEDVVIAEESNPATSDNIKQNLLMIGGSLVCFGGLYLIIKQKTKKA